MRWIRLVALAWVSASVLVACRPTIVPRMRPAINTVTAPRAAPAPTVVDSPNATALSQPVSVGVSLREAEQGMLAWFDPTRDPRIEWSKYVGRDALLDSSAIDHALVDWWPPDDAHEVPRMDLPEVVILVAASSSGLDDLTPNSQTSVDRWPIDNCDPPVRRSPQREEVVGVFDPSSGARLAAWNLRQGMDALRALSSLRAAVSDHARTTATPTPRDSTAASRATTAVPAPVAHQPLTRASLPPDLRPTFAAYPLAPGTSWTWRVTTLDNGVKWSAKVVTETIVGAWMEGDLAVVESAVDERYLTPRDGSDALDDQSARHRRYVGPKVIAGDVTGLREAEALATLEPPHAPGAPPDGVALERLVFPLDFDNYGDPSVGDELVDVDTRAGHFTGCWSVSLVGGAYWGSWRAFCPGVGYVQTERAVCAGPYSVHSQADLIRWHRAALPER